MRIEEYGTGALIEAEDTCFTFEVTENPRDFASYRTKEDSLQWDNDNFHIGGFKIHPYGDSNDLDEQMRLVIQNHYMAAGQLTKKKQMLWGQGPHLYIEKLEGNQLVRELVKDKEVLAWLKSFDYENYLLNCIDDYNHAKGAFTKMYRAKSSRKLGNKYKYLNKNKIAKLEHVPHNKARRASLKSNHTSKPTHVVVTDWNFNHIQNLTDYNAYKEFDFNNPFAERNSIYYSNEYSFCTDYYAVPDLYGSLEWLRRSTAIPLIFKALSNNSMNIKYHIQSPKHFWDQKREDLKTQCVDEKINYKEVMFSTWKKNFLKKVAEVLTGDDNVGKFWHTEKVIDVGGHNLLEQGWEIKAIDQNIKDFVKAHIDISDKADRVISASFGLHGALGNVSSNGKSDSGSEQIYAFKNYLSSGVDIPEMIVCKPLNYALQSNWPEKDLKIGFARATPQAESEVTPSERIKNN